MAQPKVRSMRCPHCVIMKLLKSVNEQADDDEGVIAAVGMVLADLISMSDSPEFARHLMRGIHMIAFSKAIEDNAENAMAVSHMLGFQNLKPTAEDHVH